MLIAKKLILTINMLTVKHKLACERKTFKAADLQFNSLKFYLQIDETYLI